MHPLLEKASGYIKNIMERSIQRKPEERVVVVFDRQSGLSRIMADAYQAAIPDGDFIDFDQVTPEQILEKINSLKPRDIVVLVQSTSFRLNQFRFRLELFNRKLKTVEHLHLDRMGEDQWETWINALSFDPIRDGTFARELKEKIDQAKRVEIACGEYRLVWEGGMEEAKLNIGDYTGMENIGGTYPIGEVFSEAKDLTRVNGEFLIYAFAGEDFQVRFFKPFLAIVRNGLIEAGPDAPEEFKDVLKKISETEQPIVREFGIGLNAAITREHPVNDITAFERIRGLHLSLGEKHSVYKKPGLVPQKTRFHVDVFPAFNSVHLDEYSIIL